jgi:DNA-binding transcriptional LysR family regulator
MDIRQLQYLVALAREKNFTRAAEACRVTQPTLSDRIRGLEQELGVPLVERGQRFHGLTPEGLRVLAWAHVILEHWTGMTQELAQMKQGVARLTGRIALGSIPSALTMAPLLVAATRARHPGICFSVLSHSSAEIIDGLESFGLDAGITYLDDTAPAGFETLALYRERYCLFLRRDHRLAQESVVGWREAAAEPLCLLTPNMQNRHIIDRAFAQVQAAPVPQLETNSVINLCSSVHVLGLASILPEYFLNVLGPLSDIAAVPLADPLIEQPVGLIALKRDPPSPLTAALFATARQADLTALRGS